MGILSKVFPHIESSITSVLNAGVMFLDGQGQACSQGFLEVSQLLGSSLNLIHDR